MILTGSQALLGVILLLAFWALWRAQRDNRHPYDIRDILIDTSTGKASLNSHIIAGMAVMGLYTCMMPGEPGPNKVNLILGVLAVFVLGRMGAQAISAFKPANENVEEPVRPASPSKDGPKGKP